MVTKQLNYQFQKVWFYLNMYFPLFNSKLCIYSRVSLIVLWIPLSHWGKCMVVLLDTLYYQDDKNVGIDKQATFDHKRRGILHYMPREYWEVEHITSIASKGSNMLCQKVVLPSSSFCFKDVPWYYKIHKKETYKSCVREMEITLASLKPHHGRC